MAGQFSGVCEAWSFCGEGSVNVKMNRFNCRTIGSRAVFSGAAQTIQALTLLECQIQLLVERQQLVE